MSKLRQTAHVAMPLWMRDTMQLRLTPTPNLEAQIFDNLHASIEAAEDLYPGERPPTATQWGRGPSSVRTGPPGGATLHRSTGRRVHAYLAPR